VRKLAPPRVIEREHTAKLTTPQPGLAGFASDPVAKVGVVAADGKIHTRCVGLGGCK